MDAFIAKVETVLIDPIITLVALAAFILFVVGVVKYIKNADNPTERAKGTQSIIWGLIGLMILFGAKAILNLLQNIVKG